MVLTDPTLESEKKLILKVFPEELWFLKQVSDHQRFDQVQEIFEAYKAYADEQEAFFACHAVLCHTP